LISKLNPNITGETSHRKVVFEFNKNAGMYVCPAGHLAIRKARTGKKNQGANQAETYSFNIEKYKVCLMRIGCYKEGSKSKTYSMRVKSKEHKEKLRLQETNEFKTLSKKIIKLKK